MGPNYKSLPRLMPPMASEKAVRIHFRDYDLIQDCPKTKRDFMSLLLVLPAFQWSLSWDLYIQFAARRAVNMPAAAHYVVYDSASLIR